MEHRERSNDSIGVATTEIDSGERSRPRSRDVAVPSRPAFDPDFVLADRYRVVRFIARGGMGEVYEAEDLELRTRVALKSIAPEVAADHQMIERLKREVLLARKVTHPNVCRLHDLGVHEDARGTMVFLTMDLLRGDTLAQLTARRGRFPTAEALPIVRDMVSALDAAHAAGVIHRDFKSRNVILVEGGERGESSPLRAVVMDFGIAVATREEERSAHETDGSIAGTPAYMAPEQITGGKVTPATDVYALGMVMFEMVTGTLPFDPDRPLEVLSKRLSEPAPAARSRLRSLDRRWSDVIARCLERDPSKRFASAGEVLVALTAQAPTWSRGRVAAVAVCVLLALGSGAVVLRAHGGSERATSVNGRRPTLAFVGMKNASGDADAEWLATALPDMLRAELLADEAVRVVGADRVDRAKRDLALVDVSDLSPGVLARLHDNLGADYVVTGRYETTGDALHVEVSIDDVRTGARVGRAVVADGARGKTRDLVATLGASLRAELGLHDPSAAQAKSARAASPGNEAATKAYAEGQARQAAGDSAGALDAFERAVAADPTFPLAHAGLAQAAASLGYDGRALEEATKAFETSHDLSREDQLVVEARYRSMAKEWDRAAEIWRTLVGFFPDNLDYGLRYAQSLWAAGRPAEAFPVLAALRKLPAPDRDNPWIDYYESIAASKVSDFTRMVAAGKKARESARRMGAALLEARGQHQVADGLTFLFRPDEAISEWETARALYAKLGNRQGETDSINGLAHVYLLMGQPARALPLAEESLARTREVGQRYKIAGGVVDVAEAQFGLGNTGEARVRYDEARGLYEAIHDGEGIGNAIGGIALTLEDDGDLAAARASMLDARKRLHDVGERDGVTDTTIELAEMDVWSADLPGALHEVADAEALATELALPFYTARCKLVRAMVAREAGDAKAAAHLAEEARAGFEAVRAGTETITTMGMLATLALDDGRAADAADLARKAADRAHAASEVPEEASALATLATALLAQKDRDGARDALDRAQALATTRLRALLDVALARGALLASSGNVTAARAVLDNARERAEKGGYVTYAHAAQLALAHLR